MSNMIAQDDFDYLDDDGYPTDEVLDKIKNWKFNSYKAEEFLDFMEFVGKLWSYPERWSHNKVGDIHFFDISTGGWSGNESLISVMRENYIFWGNCWVCSKRGGYYEFEILI